MAGAVKSFPDHVRPAPPLLAFAGRARLSPSLSQSQSQSPSPSVLAFAGHVRVAAAMPFQRTEQEQPRRSLLMWWRIAWRKTPSEPQDVGKAFQTEGRGRRKVGEAEAAVG